MSKPATIPRNRKLFRVHWWYRTEGDEIKATASILLTEPEADALAADLASSAQTDPSRKPYVRADTKAVADFEADRALRRLDTKKSKGHA